VRGVINGQVVPQTEGLSNLGLHRAIDEQVVEHKERQEKVDIADLVPNSEEAGTRYYVVDCAACKAAIPFKHAPEGEPILRLPTMMVRCFQCGTVHTYASDLISHRKAVAPSEISRKDRPAETPNNGQEASRDRHADRGDGDTKGREIAESKIEPETSSLQRNNGAIAAVSGKRTKIFFLSASFLAIGLIFQVALNIFYPVPRSVFNEAHSYGLATLFDTAYFGAILCGLSFLIFGTGSFLVETYDSERNVLGKEVLVILRRNAFMRSLTTRLKSSAKTVNVTSVARQASRLLLPMASGAATFRSRIKRSATSRPRHYR
jgi:hypothetical protein